MRQENNGSKKTSTIRAALKELVNEAFEEAFEETLEELTEEVHKEFSDTVAKSQEYEQALKWVRSNCSTKVQKSFELHFRSIEDLTIQQFRSKLGKFALDHIMI